ncbi:SAM-dependent methyltransferase [Rhodoferax sp.]|jgi:cyclopropane-fatty-acyl-phospholipid synthase|uniref:SAM-dependent methyltransferase n=1 Tax=Rhodoferax sp. TaxID=50421 RepID=UPI00271A286C|nr:cyclopropane-fatty-acyl-phospholipid synthase family protein [Rhodoferax sp.]MDO9145984.1 cyclopropane-fatty-acyl-phospholipid synthase family protein [Rhodoferax sp.]MDP1527998.1 cyclopropane-fatty-acyl-phospholipid synthase family protein [Rhodoferax sp.]MDP1942647.1 cyclopropane-fatty-acyl-phospholipid synthase family protein [Rhodoferax sp.]MDP2439946.1 cyclopropane-fatty-acyl-phospholipid synthase family protein [Rhodoferax sp.]MDP3191897.1 cyclopropane-fatty-acyl-phospholipid synthase
MDARVAPLGIAHQGLTHCLTRLAPGSDIPLRLTLWNGMQHDLGPQPSVTVNILSPGALRYFVPPSLDNLAEGYVNGHFDVLGQAADIVATADRLARHSVPMRGRFGRLVSALRHDRGRDAHAIAHHYDVSNDFYQLWLDEAMVYSCAYFPSRAESLAAAQSAKLDHILGKLMLQPGERLLDIGCGWGALAIRAAQKYGARVLGVTLSKNQHALACERVAQAGMAGQVEIRLQDYRDIEPGDGQFDKITSIGMFEHVGLNHLASYFAKIHALLKDGGLVLNHGITSTDPDSGTTPLGAASFIEKYVFPNGELPHISLALKDMQSAGLEALDVECLRRHYMRTLACWSDNYEHQQDAIRALVDETTYRVWRIYLAGCAHAFAQNWVSIYQVLACKAGTRELLNPTPWSRAYMYA